MCMYYEIVIQYEIFHHREHAALQPSINLHTSVYSSKMELLIGMPILILISFYTSLFTDNITN